MESRKKSSKVVVDKENKGKRIDKFLAEFFKSEFSRSLIKKLIDKGKITVNAKEISPHYKLKENDEIDVVFPEIKSTEPEKENIKLDIVFENKELAIINKPAGMVVHPSDDGQYMSGSLVNALLNQYGRKGLSDLNGNLRPGIVHRIDKDTSGLLIIAKNNKIHEYLVGLMKNRSIEKKYIVLVKGNIKNDTGRIEAPIKRNIKDRKKMSIAAEGDGREAFTEYEVLERYKIDDLICTLLEVKILTGRTHQIRVHFQSIGYPVVGDLVYGNKKTNELFLNLGLKRQFLHAKSLRFEILDGDEIKVKNKLPKDLNEVLKNLETI